jgi:hypothetical protein
MFTLFNVDFKRHNCSSAWSISAANAIGVDSGILHVISVTINDW